MILWQYKIITSIILLSVGAIVGYSLTFDLKSREILCESKLIQESLKKALNYLEKRSQNVTEDLILGIFIVKANLGWIINRLECSFSDSTWAKERLKQLLKQCHNIIALHKSKNILLKENLWKEAAGNLKYGFLSQVDNEFFLPEFDSCQSIDTYMMKGTPENSDFCLNELVTSKCKVSDYCWLSEVNKDFHFGYKTSHRLLYFQIAFKEMLLEAMALFKSSSFSLSRDLFMEQIALCGLEGYEEFAVPIWRDQVRSWQYDNGCFGRDTDMKNCSIYKPGAMKIKRTDSTVDECHNHVTAVAISALAFFLRVTLKIAYNLP